MKHLLSMILMVGLVLEPIGASAGLKDWIRRVSGTRKHDTQLENKFMQLFVSRYAEVNTVSQWIEKYTASDHRKFRRAVLKPYLKLKLPAVHLKENKILIFSDRSKVPDSLEVKFTAGHFHYIFNGEDYTPGASQSERSWFEQRFGLKPGSKTGLLDFFINEAHAGFWLGVAVAAVVIGAASDTGREVTSGSKNYSGRDLEKIRNIVGEELDKRFFNQVEVQKNIHQMTLKSVEFLRKGSDLKCTHESGKKYPGAQFSREVEGRTISFTSSPQDELPTMNLEIKGQGGKSTYFYNHSSGNFLARSFANGKKPEISESDSSLVGRPFVGGYILPRPKLSLTQYTRIIHLAMQDRAVCRAKAITKSLDMLWPEKEDRQAFEAFSNCKETGSDCVRELEHLCRANVHFFNQEFALSVSSGLLCHEIESSAGSVAAFKYMIEGEARAAVRGERSQHAWQERSSIENICPMEKSLKESFERFKEKESPEISKQGRGLKLEPLLTYMKQWEEKQKNDGEYYKGLNSYSRLLETAEMATACCRTEACRDGLNSERKLLKTRDASKLKPAR